MAEVKISDDPLRDAALKLMLQAAVAAYKNMTPEQKARHDYEQKRSFVRGMCPSEYSFDAWCRQVDWLLPPLE